MTCAAGSHRSSLTHFEAKAIIGRETCWKIM